MKENTNSPMSSITMSPLSLSMECKENNERIIDERIIGTDDQSSDITDKNAQKMEIVLSDTPCSPIFITPNNENNDEVIYMSDEQEPDNQKYDDLPRDILKDKDEYISSEKQKDDINAHILTEKPNEAQLVNHKLSETKQISESPAYKPVITHFTKINRNLSKDIAALISIFNDRKFEIQELQSSINEQREILNDLKTLCNEWTLQNI